MRFLFVLSKTTRNTSRIAPLMKPHYSSILKVWPTIICKMNRGAEFQKLEGKNTSQVIASWPSSLLELTNKKITFSIHFTAHLPTFSNSLYCIKLNDPNENDKFNRTTAADSGWKIYCHVFRALKHGKLNKNNVGYQNKHTETAERAKKSYT